MDIVHIDADTIFAQITRRSFDHLVIGLTENREKNCNSFPFRTLEGTPNISHLSNDGSLLNISFGTVAGASGTKPMSDCRDCKCRSTSSAVMCPSENALFLFAAACAFAAFFVNCFFRFGGFAPLPCEEFIASPFRLNSVYMKAVFSTHQSPWLIRGTYFFVFSVRTSSSDDSVSSLSDDEFSGFSYCSNRSNRNERSLVTFNSRR